MELIRKILLAFLGLTLVAVTVLTWGSIGSAATAFCLITMVSALIFQKFMTNRDGSDFQIEE